MKTISPFDQLKRDVVLFKKIRDDYTIRIKPISLTRDIPVIHKWVNMDYAKAFWQMEGSYASLYRHYEKIISSGIGYSLVFFINHARNPVALIDVYQAQHDEVGKHHQWGPEDYGIHVLMAPNKKPVSGLTDHVLDAGLFFLFTLSISRIVGEPDVRNIKANELIKRAGFRFLKEIKMASKRANLYCLSKEEFLNSHH